MKRSVVTCALGLLSVCAQYASGQSKNDVATPPAELRVWIYDYAGLSLGTLRTAEFAAGRIFRLAGAHVSWEERSSHDEVAGAPVRWPVQYPMIIRIIPNDRLSTFSSHTLGASIGCCYATLYYGRAVAYSNALNVNPDILLGCAIAHEMGHLLLPAEGHTPTGIMSSDWTEKDLSSKGLVRLVFAPAESVRIRSAIASRAARVPGTATGALTLAVKSNNRREISDKW
jgi:hypothetical protein